MQNKKKIPVCLIGAGRIGLSHEFDKKRIKPASHVGMWTSFKQTKLVGICDKKLSNFILSKKINKKIKYFRNPIKMIKEMKPKIVSIATWKDTHYKMTKLCLNLDVKVIVLEKPLANNISEAKKLINLMNKKKSKIIVNHRRRFDDEIIKLRKRIKNGEIGKIIQASSYYVYGLLTTGTHVVDTLRFLLKDVAGEVDKVSGFENKMRGYHSKDDKNYDAIIFFKNGLKATMQSLDIKKYDIFDFHIYGTKGKLLITGIGRSIFKYKIIKSPEHDGFEELSLNPYNICSSLPRKQFLKLAQNAKSCLQNDKTKPLCSAYDSYVDMEVIDKIILSAKENSIIKKIKLK